MPYSLIEAIRAGVPIIGRKVTGVEDIITNTNGGCLLDTKDPQRFAQEILNNEKTCDRKKIIKLYQEKYSLKQMIQEITKYYHGAD